MATTTYAPDTRARGAQPGRLWHRLVRSLSVLRQRPDPERAARRRAARAIAAYPASRSAAVVVLPSPPHRSTVGS